MCIFGAQSYAQTAKFILDNRNNSVKCEILNTKGEKIAESKNDTLDYTGQIIKIGFEEKHILQKEQKHSFQIGEKVLVFKDKTKYISGKSFHTKELRNSITLQPSNEIIVKRDTVIIGKIVVKPKALTFEEKVDKIKITPLEDKFKNFTFEKKEIQIFKYELSGIADINVNVEGIQCNDIQIPSTFANNRIEFSIDPSILEKDKEDTIRCSLKISDGKNSIEKTLPIGKVLSPFESGLSTWEIVIIIALLCIISVSVLLYRRHLTIKKYGKEIDLYDDTNNLRILASDDDIKIGDRANKSGCFLTKDGYVYEISKKNKFSWARVTAIRVRVTDKNGKYFEFDPNDSPDSYPYFKYVANNNLEFQISKGTRVNDVEDTREFEFENGYIIKVENNSISEIIRKISDEPNSVPNDDIPYEEIKNKLAEVERELRSRPTRQEYEELSRKLQEAKQKNKEDEEKINDIDRVVEQAKKVAKAEERKHMEITHKKDIIDNYIPLSEHKQKLSKSDKVAKDAADAKEKSDKALKQKETELNLATDKISELEKVVLEKKTEIIIQKATIAKLKEAAQKKNVHFVYQVQETLEELSNTFKDVYKDMTNSTIKDGFISPMLKGVSGLGTGILSWAEDYTVKVKGDSEGFFGGDFMTMKEEYVKETISKKFISNIVKSDSFSKFVRLYQLSTVPFIRKQFVEAGMNINVLNKLYYKVYVLVSEFGYQIICPRLFEEQHSDKKYQWFNSTNLFNIIELPEEEKKAIKELGPETIIDVNQIGFVSPWVSRSATAVTPDF